jgi:hypothetical protein
MHQQEGLFFHLPIREVILLKNFNVQKFKRSQQEARLRVSIRGRYGRDYSPG